MEDIKPCNINKKNVGDTCNNSDSYKITEFDKESECARCLVIQATIETDKQLFNGNWDIVEKLKKLGYSWEFEYDEGLYTTSGYYYILKNNEVIEGIEIKDLIELYKEFRK